MAEPRIHRTLLGIDERFRSQFTALAADPVITEHGFRIFETFRTKERQNLLIARGTTRAPWPQSAHNWGLGADFVKYVDGTGWEWPPADCLCWDALAERARFHGLEQAIDWDRPHISVPHWKAYCSTAFQQHAGKLFQ